MSDVYRVPAPWPARALSIEDLCYNAFMTARAANDEDGGPTDWMTDTKPKLQPMIDAFNARINNLQSTVEECRVFAVNVSAFLARDGGTPRIDQTASGLVRISANLAQRLADLQKEAR